MKGLKIAGIVLGSILGLVLIIVCTALWLVFTPSRLTPIVNKQLPRFVTCEAHVERVELTFFSSFPRFGMQIEGLTCGTLADIERINAAIDVRAFLKENKLMLSDLAVERGSVLLQTDSLGQTNFDILKPSPDTPEGEGGLTLSYVDLNALTIKDLDVRYATPELDVAVRLGMELAATVEISTASATLHKLLLSVNGMEFDLSGSVQYNLLTGLHTDLRYRFGPWRVAELLALVPPSMQGALDGIEVDGTLASEGTIKGIYKDNTMPTVDLKLLFEKGSVVYPAMLPYPLHDVVADLRLHTDLATDTISFATIEHLEARTPNSSLKLSGRIDRLFSDPRMDLSASLNANLIDARPFIPRDLKVKAKGNVSGNLRARARMSHLQAMALDRMQISGNLNVTNLDASYDTIHIASPRIALGVTLPASGKNKRTRFAGITVSAPRLNASAGASTTANINGMTLSLETSNVLDTRVIPAVIANFAFADLAAAMDDMTLSVKKPAGTLTLEPGRRNAATQRLHLKYGSDAITTAMGTTSATVGRADIDAGITYNQSREDLWTQLSPRGSVSVNGTVVKTPMLNYPVEIPTLAMDFTPQHFHIQKARVVLNESDFSLDGTIDDIRSYIRGTSPLRAEFNFNSPITNVTQLLALTSGIGSEEEETPKEEPEVIETETLTEPYMVPKGVDITFHANIGRALWYSGKPEPNVFSNIHGDLRVADGKLYVSPEISFSSPATDGQIMFIYETPRPDHLFAGVLLHLNNIEIRELLGFIPDLDELIPMLRSFNGRGEFHLSAGGYMNSDYRFKLSTLRGAGSVAATDLTLQDHELFDQIAPLLKYKNEEKILRVDSLSAEFTILRDKVDLYPFLFSIDRYQAVISGRHAVNMDFDYNISLVQSPLPFRAAVDVSSKGGKMKFKLAKSKYPDFYRPHRQNVVENQELELRKIIRESLVGTAN